MKEEKGEWFREGRGEMNRGEMTRSNGREAKRRKACIKHKDLKATNIANSLL